MFKSLFRTTRPASTVAAAVAANFTGDEAQILAVGKRMLDMARANPDPKGLKDQLADWAMQDDGFKVNLFRFIDVYPKLQHDPDLVYAVLTEYLSQPGVNMPAGAAAMLKMGAMAKGLVNKQLQGNIEAMASRYIAGVDAAEALPHLKKRWDGGVCFTADLLGEACVSVREAEVYRERYMDLIVNLSEAVKGWKDGGILERDHLGAVPRANVSIKLSSLADKFDPTDRAGSIDRCFMQLKPLLEEAGKRNVLVNFDVEQESTKELNLAIFRHCCEKVDFPAGLAMQAYLRSGDADAKEVIDWAKSTGRQVTVRLVKGAYWDYEVINSGEKGWPIPVWTDKRSSDACYERMAQLFINAMPRTKGEGGVKLALGSHNLRTIASCMTMLDKAGLPKESLEMQALYGMGHGVKEAVKAEGFRLREYVPVGELVPGMAYLVRRLLENTSNESWLMQGLTKDTPAEKLLASPHDPKRVEPNPNKDNALSPAVAGVGDGKAFVTEPFRDFSKQAQREPFAAAIAAVKVPQVANDATVEQANAAMDAAFKAFRGWRARDAKDRANILCKAADLMRGRRDELSAVVVVESGKPWKEADADVCEAIDFCDYYARTAPALFDFKRLGAFMGELNQTIHQPKGVAVIISPWNFPLAIACGMATAALVTGNTAILKPAEQTPGIAKLLCEILWQAGVPKDVLHFLAGQGETVGAALVRHPKTSLIAFTGSKGVGLNIIEAAGKTVEGQPNVKRVVCEMGGKNAIIVDATADLDEAIPQIRHSAFGFAGQKCSAASRLLVHEAIYDEFVHRFCEAVQALKVGDPRHPGTDIGPVIDDEAGAKIRHYIELGKKENKLLLAHQPAEAQVLGKPLIGPHVFEVSSPDCALMRDEIFGPVLAVLKVKDFDQALDIANDHPYKLTGAAFTRTPTNLEKARHEFRVGNLYINRKCTGAYVYRQPFGGFKLSGIGSKAGGPDYLLQFMVPRTITENTMRRGFAPGMEGATAKSH